jgi:hypothetical protein
MKKYILMVLALFLVPLQAQALSKGNAARRNAQRDTAAREKCLAEAESKSTSDKQYTCLKISSSLNKELELEEVKR